MTDGKTIRALEETLKGEIQAEQDRIRIVDVRIGEVDPIEDAVEVQIVFEGKVKDIDPLKRVDLIGVLRARLPEIGIAAFPLISFVSRKEAGVRPLAPA
jgi:hypothetical protein